MLSYIKKIKKLRKEKINIIIQQLKKFLEKERGKKFKKRALNSY